MTKVVNWCGSAVGGGSSCGAGASSKWLSASRAWLRSPGRRRWRIGIKLTTLHLLVYQAQPLKPLLSITAIETHSDAQSSLSAAAEWSRLLFESHQTSAQYGCCLIAGLGHLRHTLPLGDIHIGTTPITALPSSAYYARLPAGPGLPCTCFTMLDHHPRAYRPRVNRECRQRGP